MTTSVHTSFTLADLVDENSRARPADLAVIDGDFRATFRDLARRTRSAARALAASHVAEGDRILWLGENRHHLLELVIAASRVGAAVCPVNWRQSAEEVGFVISDLEPALIVYEPDVAADWSVSGDPTRKTLRVADDDRDEYEDWLGTAPGSETPSVRDDSTAVLILYTAAFDGRPNGAMLSDRALLAHAAALSLARRIDNTFRFLTTGPLFHIGSMMFVWASFSQGGSVVVMRRFEPAEACRLVEQEKCTSAMLFPVMVDQLVETNSDQTYDLSSLVFAAGSPEWNSMITPDESPWGRSNAGYGQTEVGGMLTLHAFGIDGVGTSGRATPFVQVRIVDDADADVEDGEVGEFATRGWHVFNGYFNRPQLNAQRFRNGWYHTNDLGRREPDGTLTFIGPKARMIKTGGENVYPADVESLLRRHPGIADVAVIGQPDETWGQRVAAIVVVADGAELTGQDVAEHVRAHAARYKQPREVHFADEIPRDGFVVDYDSLDARFGGGGYVGAGSSGQRPSDSDSNQENIDDE